ncbi:MAG: ATP synthase F1 subunit epsilon [Oscillospiraceae bacterium]|nr:ATP synthase F1 subunit epsilon [Oscillospiraceae bacterium]
MSKLFNLKILTPERTFFDGDVEGVTVDASDGNLMILADHTPIITPVSIGNIGIKIDSMWEHSINSEGFLEVREDGVLIFVQACERPEEIDARRAEEAKKRAEEQMRQKQSMSEYKQSKVALARALARLQAGSSRMH